MASRSCLSVGALTNRVCTILTTGIGWWPESGRRRGRPNVTSDQDQHRGNRLLAALRPRDYALLEPHLQIVPIGEGELLHLPGDEIEKVYFLHSGIVSLMAMPMEATSPR
jgi:hypothetical protein